MGIKMSRTLEDDVREMEKALVPEPFIEAYKEAIEDTALSFFLARIYTEFVIIQTSSQEVFRTKEMQIKKCSIYFKSIIAMCEMGLYQMEQQLKDE